MRGLPSSSITEYSYGSMVDQSMSNQSILNVLSISSCLLFSAFAIAALRTFSTLLAILLFENFNWFTALLTFLLTIDLVILASLSGLTLIVLSFAFYLIHFPVYKDIYGALAIIPLLFVWVFISWVVILVGAQVAASLDGFLDEERTSANEDAELTRL